MSTSTSAGADASLTFGIAPLASSDGGMNLCLPASCVGRFARCGFELPMDVPERCAETSERRAAPLWNDDGAAGAADAARGAAFVRPIAECTGFFALATPA
jgi:hypothetical protein